MGLIRHHRVVTVSDNSIVVLEKTNEGVDCSFDFLAEFFDPCHDVVIIIPPLRFSVHVPPDATPIHDSVGGGGSGVSGNSGDEGLQQAIGCGGVTKNKEPV